MQPLTTPATGKYIYSLFDVPANTGLAGAIRLTFSPATALVNKPVRLTWTVTNGFPLTAQQCHASVQMPASGNVADAGTWAGAQTGAISGSVYTGSAAIIPTAAGTYTYALTCGGTQSGCCTALSQAAKRGTREIARSWPGCLPAS